MAKEKEKKKVDLVTIKARKVAKNLIVMVGKTKFVVPDVSEKDVKSIQNKILLYTKKPTEALQATILDIIDIASKVEEQKKVEEKGLKKVIKKASKTDENKEKKKRTKELIERAKKKAKKNPVIQNLVAAKTGGLAMKGAEIVEMPDLLVNRIEDFLNKEVDITPLLNFWSLCLLNPNDYARKKLFDYINHNGFMITPSGYFVTYRMVKTLDAQDKPLPKGVYTDARTHTLKYIPGTVCRIPREECDEDGAVECSTGLHTGTPAFIGIVAQKKTNLEEGKTVGEGYGTGTKKVVVKEWQPGTYGTGYGAANDGKYVNKDKIQKFNNSFGNQAIICLVNPQHVVSVPDYDIRKMRSCEFYFCKLTTAEEVIDMVEKDYLLFDADYQNFELKDLQELLKNKDLKAYVESKTDVGAKIANLEKKLAKVREEIKLGGDSISPDLDLIAIKAIINQRVKTLK